MSIDYHSSQKKTTIHPPTKIKHTAMLIRVGTNLKRLSNLPSTIMCLSFTTVGTATGKLSFFQKKQTTNYILSSKKSNKYHKKYTFSFSLFLFEKNKVSPRNYPIFIEFSRTFLW